MATTDRPPAKSKGKKKPALDSQAADALHAALEATRADPASEDRWDELEDLAGKANRPDEVGALYREVVAMDLPRNLGETIAVRAVQFHEEWFGEDSEELAKLLGQVIESDPEGSEWAFQRLTMLHTSAERWDELLSLYDRVLETTTEDHRRVQLLEEAAQAAKDFALRPDRAIDYLQKLLPLKTDDPQLAASLERLYERQERWDDLVSFWKDRLDTLGAADRRATRLRIATLCLDTLKRPDRALEEATPLLDDKKGAADACALLERIVNLDDAAPEVRRKAFSLLKAKYDAEGRGSDVVRALDTALGFADHDQAVQLHREAAERLAAQGQPAEAMDHWASLLRLAPSAGDARDALRSLAESSGAHERFAVALVDAAAASGDAALRADLRIEAAEVRRNALRDPSAAIALYVEALPDAEEQPLVARTVVRRLGDLYEQTSQDELRLAMLERLAALEPEKTEKRTVLGTVARLAEKLGQPDRALAAWQARLDLDSADVEALDASVDLLEREERWSALVDGLRKRLSAPLPAFQRRADLERIARVQADKLESFDRAIDTWVEVASAFGEDAATVDALTALYTHTARWQELAALLERTTGRESAHVSDVLAKLGDVCREHLGDSARAIGAYRQALAASPRHEGARAGLSALVDDARFGAEAIDALALSYEQTDDWEPALGMLEPRLKIARDDKARVRLLREAAAVQEKRASKPDDALASVRRAFVLAPEDDLFEADVVRLAGVTDRWDLAAASLQEAAEAIASKDPRRAAHLLARAADVLENKLSDGPGALSAWAAAVRHDWRRTDAIEGVARTASSSGLHEVAEGSLSRAVDDGAGEIAIRRLVEVRRKSPGRPLFDSLMKLADIAGDDLDPLHEAATLALEQLGERGLAQSVLTRVYEEASRRFRSGAKAAGRVAPEEATMWAAEHLIRMREEAGEHERALAMLVEVSRLPCKPEVSAALRRRAAVIAAETLDDRRRAMDLYRGVLEDSPNDTQAIDALAKLYEAEERYPELLTLRKQELSVTQEKDRRLAVRLEIARLVGIIETRGGRVEALRANLSDQPGHPESIRVITDVLTSAARFGELADLLSEQAGKLEANDQRSPAAKLYATVAKIAEQQLGDVDRAIKAHRRVVELEMTTEALDALSRIHTSRGEHAAASQWLERRFAGMAPAERTGTGLWLAREQLAAGRPERAVEVLETVRAEEPANVEVRDMLAAQYRADEAWEPLAVLLSDATAYVQDDAALLALVHESAQLFHEKVGRPEKAISVLQKGAELAPDDRDIRKMLAESLRAAGRFDEARQILESIIEMYGRRRNPERAQVHHQLARVAHAQGDLEAALEQLELASKMDMSNAVILRSLGDLAREAGELDRAERAFRTLLLVVRRRSPDEPADVGVAEVLYELHRIAESREDHAQSKELLDSAMETAAQSAVESRRLKEALLERKAPDLLLEALQRRLTVVEAGPERAAVLSDIADVLDQALGRSDEAFARRISALGDAPNDASIHDATLELARKLGKVEDYADVVRKVLDGSRREEDAKAVAELLLRLAQVEESDLANLDAARELYRRVEASGARQVDAWLGLARIAGKRGDEAEEVRVLSQLVAAEGVPGDARTDALYRLAEVQLANDAQREEGVANLRKALDRDPRPARVGAVLRAAAAASPDADGVLALYEEVARSSGDDALLLDYLERRASRPTATLREIREGVEKAMFLGENERADALLARAVELAEKQEDGLGGARWALLALAERREASGDIAGAVEALKRAAESADGDDATALQIRLARLAMAGGKLKAAAQAYQRLLEADPTNREIWEPMLDCFVQIGDVDALRDLVRRLLDALLDSEARNAVRMKWAEFLMNDEERQFEAVDALKDVLGDDPENAAAAAMLGKLYEKSGYSEDLVELIERQLDVARDKQDLEQIVELTLKLGALLEKVRREDAIHAYRRAFDWVPAERRIIVAMLSLLGDDHDPRERTEVRERLLAIETGKAAGKLAREIYAEWEQLDEPEGMQRALELGYRGHPDDDDLRTRLEQWYREREDYNGLSRFLEAEAARAEDPVARVARMRDAAALMRDNLGDSRGAMEVLRRAREMVPSDLGLLHEIAATLATQGDHQAAISEVTSSLEANDDAAIRLSLLRLRAQLALGARDESSAVEDLEEAYASAPGEVAAELIDALERRRDRAAAGRDQDGERGAALRLVDVLDASGQNDRARDVLAAWVDRSPADRDALHKLRVIDAAAERWDEVAATCARLIAVEEGDGRIEAALGLADACERAGRPQDAREGLETVQESQPGDVRISDRLRALYETIGAYRELATLLLVDAGAATDNKKKFELLKKAGHLLLQPDGDVDAALHALAEAVQLNPEDYETVVLLADAYMAGGHWAEAGQLLEHAISSHTKRRSPELSMLQHRMSRLAAAAGDGNLQMQWLGAALDSDKNNGEVAAELAELAMSLGELEVAMNALRAVTLMKNEGPMSRAMAFLLQAKIAHQQGESRRAVLWARKAKAEDPNLTEATAFLQELGES